MSTTKKKRTPAPPMSPREAIAAAIAGVDRAALREFIDRHEGVIVEMEKDQAGLEALGLVTDRVLMRGPLTARLSAILNITEERAPEDQITAYGYAATVRVRNNRLGPRVAAEAQRSHAENVKERAQILDALAVYGKDSKHGKAGAAGDGDAAKHLGMGISEFRRRELALRITMEEVKRRRKELLTCVACRLISMGLPAKRHAHLDGCSRAAA